MDERRIGYCRDVARTVLRRAGINEPPVDVYSLAEQDGARVVKSALGSLDGRASRENGGWLIEINPERSRTAQRFTVAHEIGHIRLGHEECGYDDLEERQANTFAAELLMPLAMLKTSLKSQTELGKLARLFEVSKEAMKIKLDEQGLLMRLTKFD